MGTVLDRTAGKVDEFSSAIRSGFRCVPLAARNADWAHPCCHNSTAESVLTMYLQSVFGCAHCTQPCVLHSPRVNVVPASHLFATMFGVVMVCLTWPLPLS